MQSYIFLITLALIALTQAACPATTGPTQSYKSWAGRATSGDANITIPLGTRILFDESPNFIFNRIEVEGELIFSPDVAIDLKTKFLLVKPGGHLWIGSPDCPHQGNLKITLYGQKSLSDPPLSLANKVLGGFSGSTIDIHGRPVTSWTHLGNHARRGATSITLATAVNNWKVGDEILIASTDYSYYDGNNPQYTFLQSERRTISAISGQTVSFTEPLIYHHYGKVYTSPDDSTVSIDMRAEVALLSRNVKITGDVTEGTALDDGWGGHVFAEGNTLLRISYTELYHMGQKDNLARYPIHWHLGGDQPNAYAKGNSIHDSFQRGITVHGTNHLTIENNVVYNVRGQMFFIEDGNEVENTFKNNLGIDALPHTLLGKADTIPGIFWITNPRNHFINNVAVGGFFGFWFSMPPRPTGMAPNDPNYPFYYPRYEAMGTFKGNKAHGQLRSGIHIDDMDTDGSGNIVMAGWKSMDWSFISREDQLLYASQPVSGTNWGSWPNRLAQLIDQASDRRHVLIEDFTAYKCTEFGVWGRGENIIVRNAKLADNQFGAQFPGQANLFEESFIIGETDNLGTPEAIAPETFQGRTRPYRWSPQTTIIGYRHYDAGSPDMVRNVKFVNFQPMNFFYTGKTRQAAAISVQGGNHVIAPRNKYYRVSFIRTPIRVFFEETTRNYVAHRGAVVIDVDGSITGTCGNEIVARSPILIDSNCVHYPAWQAYICPPGGRPHRFMRVEDKTDNSGVTFSDEIEEVARNKSFMNMIRLFDQTPHRVNAYYESKTGNVFNKRRTQMTVNAMSNEAYFLQFGDEGATPKVLQLAFNYAGLDEWVKFAIPYPSGTTFSFEGSRFSSSSYVPVSSIEEVNTTAYFYDTNTNLLWIGFNNRELRFHDWFGKQWLDNQLHTTITAACPNDDCTQYVNPSSISWNRRSGPSGRTICEEGGSLIGGRSVWSPASSRELPVFTDTVDPEWRIVTWSNNYNLTNSMAADNSATSIRADIGTSWWSIMFQRANKAKVFNPNDYSHLEFKIRMEDRVLNSGIWVRAQNHENRDIDPIKYPGVDLSDPLVSPSAPIDHTKWHHVRIPISRLGMNEIGDIWRFSVWSDETPRAAPVFIDSIKFVDLTHSIESIEGPVNAPKVDPSLPTYLDPLRDLSVSPPVVVVPPGGGPVVSGDPQDPEAPPQYQPPEGVSNESNADPDQLPVWGIVVIAVLALLFVAATVAFVIFFIKARSKDSLYP